VQIKIGKYKLLIFLRTTKYNSNIDKDRLRRYQDKRRAKGLCRVCGVKVKRINKRTGRCYVKCEKHRRRENELKRLKR